MIIKIIQQNLAIKRYQTVITRYVISTKNTFLSSAKVEEASKENYENLFTTINQTLSSVKTAGAYDQLSFYNAVFMLLYDQRSNIAQVNISQNEVLNILDTVYKEANGLTVQKEQSLNLKKEIIDNYDTYRQAVIRTYINAEER